MPSMNIILDGDEAWPDLAEKAKQPGMILHTQVDAIARLPKGMASGKPSVCIRIDLPDGRVVLAETSLQLLDAAARGFVARTDQELGEGWQDR